MANVLKKITTRAKQIRKKQPGLSWKSSIKKASSELRGAKKGKPIAKRKRSVSVKSIQSRHREMIQQKISPALAKNILASGLKMELQKYLLKKHMATTKKERREASKKVTEINAKLKKLNW